VNLKKIKAIYKSKFGQYSSKDVQALGWGSKESQEIRFEKIKEIGIRENDHVLDVGCGIGDLNVYLGNVKYTGIDIRPAIIKAAKEKYPGIDFYKASLEELPLVEILTHSILIKYHWVVASGIFCFKVTSNKDIEKTLSLMFQRCLKGVSVNFLSNVRGKNFLKDMKYMGPDKVIKMATKITKKFSLRHDYRENDMTLYLYR